MKLSKRIIVLGLVLALVPITGTLWAIAQGDGFDIQACVNPAGKLRIVDDLSMCRKQETELEWNIQGPQGEPGPQGTVGVLGFYQVESDPVDVPPREPRSAQVVCKAAGDLVTGGGYNLYDTCLIVDFTGPLTESNWEVHVRSTCATESGFVAVAICADMTP